MAMYIIIGNAVRLQHKIYVVTILRGTRSKRRLALEQTR